MNSSNKNRQTPRSYIKIKGLVVSFGKSFFTASTIHGLNHIAANRRHSVEIFIWLCVVSFAIYAATVLSNLTLIRYNDNPTVISMERDRFSWNTSFPGATICPTYKVNEALLEKYVEKSTAANKTALKEFIVKLANASYSNFDQVPKYDGIRSQDYMKLLLELQFVFQPSVSNSGVQAREHTLQRIVSERGICYSFNSQLALYNSPEYWEAGRWDIEEEMEILNVNPLDGEVFTNVVNMSTGFDIYIHGPYEVADVASKMVNSQNGYFLQVYLSALSLYSSERARGLKVAQRKCRFYYESLLKHSPVYSYVLCRMECRITLTKKLCNCIPHFYRKLEGDSTCDVDGLHCLAKHKDRLITMKKDCSCVPNCDEVNYVIKFKDAREWFLGTNLQWGLKECPRMRLKRDIIFGFADVLVYIGGMAGLFLGCSVLSFIEIIYFFTLRLFWFVVNYAKETNEATKVRNTNE